VLGLHPPETRHQDPNVIPRALCWGEGFRYGGTARGNIHVLRASLDRLAASLVNIELFLMYSICFCSISQSITDALNNSCRFAGRYGMPLTSLTWLGAGSSREGGSYLSASTAGSGTLVTGCCASRYGPINHRCQDAFLPGC
jgi:hypothetical protein